MKPDPTQSCGTCAQCDPRRTLASVAGDRGIYAGGGDGPARGCRGMKTKSPCSRRAERWRPSDTIWARERPMRTTAGDVLLARSHGCAACVFARDSSDWPRGPNCAALAQKPHAGRGEFCGVAWDARRELDAVKLSFVVMADGGCNASGLPAPVSHAGFELISEWRAAIEA